MREPFSGISHAIGAVLSSAGLILLLMLSRNHPVESIILSIYGVSLILLYTASALYHSLDGGPKRHDRLMRLDHSAIYLLIAGTYTPITLLVLRGIRGWTFFGMEWGLAALGIFMVFFWKKMADWPRVVLYLIMGWLIALALGPLRADLPLRGFELIVAGGISYSIGAVVFSMDKPHLWPGRFSAHDLWHLFVLTGSIFQFIAIAYYLVPHP